MSAPIVSPSDCCAPCPNPVVTQVPGPQGNTGTPGTNGTNGTNGVSAFTTLSAGFTMPAINATVSGQVVTSVWATIGQVIFVQTAGYMQVTAIADSTHLTLKNLGYTGNAAAGAAIPVNSTVSPGGLQGPAGSTPTLNSISPTTTKGDIIVDNGANNPNASDVRLGVVIDGQELTSDSTQPTGLAWKTSLPLAATDNAIPRFNGASGTPIPLQTSTMILTDNGALQTIGGNARGTDAVDLQPIRAANTQVASGINSVISGGEDNTASGIRSTVAGGQFNVSSGTDSVVSGGINNTASGLDCCIGGGLLNTAGGSGTTIGGGSGNTTSNNYSTIGGGGANTASGDRSTIAGGQGNTASGTEATVGGGFVNTSSATFSCVPGGSQGRADKYGQLAHASGNFSTQGDAQTSELLMRNITTDNSTVSLFTDGAAALATMPNNTTWLFFAYIVGRNSDGNNKIWSITGGIKNNAGVVSLLAAATVTALFTDAGTWNNPSAAAGGSTNLDLQVQGTAAKTIHWLAHVRLVECGF